MHCCTGELRKAKVVAKPYSETAGDFIDPGAKQYAITVTGNSGTRKFFAAKIHRTWDKYSKHCLYSGSPQGGRIYEVPSLPHSVIEGCFDEYAVNGLFDTEYTQYKYNQFTAKCAQNLDHEQ